MGTPVAVAAPNRAAADAALVVAGEGGGAVDAAVAAMLTAMATEPGIVSVAAGAYVTVWPSHSGPAVTVDGQVAMPGAGRPAGGGPPSVQVVETEYGGGVAMTVGPGTVATPGAPAALGLAQERWGVLPWHAVVEPARDAVRAGFPLGAAAGYYLPYVRESALAWDPETASCLRSADGSWVAVGERFEVAGLADALDLVATEGAASFYTGTLARALADDQRRRGGLVTAVDLAAYRPVVRPALPFAAGRWALRTNPAPAIGGPVLAAMLELLGDRPRGEWTAEDVHALVDVQREVLDFRRHRLDVATDRVGAAAELAELVRRGGSTSPSTVHVSVVDAAGSACAITASSGYGSGATLPGTGIWLNNCLGEHELNRGEPPAPGTHLASNMAPTVGRSDDGGVLAIGTPGADRITTALTQVLAAFARGGAGLQEAVDRPRLHVHHLDDDPDGPVRVEAEEDLPHPSLPLPVRLHPARSMYFGGVGAALRHPDGSLEAAADPRREGATAVGPA